MKTVLQDKVSALNVDDAEWVRHKVEDECGNANCDGEAACIYRFKNRPEFDLEASACDVLGRSVKYGDGTAFSWLDVRRILIQARNSK